MSDTAPATQQGSPATRTEFVRRSLRERILKGEIEAGTPLRQLALADEFGVSQIPVREALLQLAAEGLVDFAPHRGAVAARLTGAEFEELCHLRVLLETDLLRQAVPRLTDENLSAAEAHRVELDALLEASDDTELHPGIARWSELNHAFHASLYAAADRPLALDLVARLQQKSDRYIRLQLLLTDWIPRACDEHRRLLDLCSDGDAEAAAELLEAHILAAGRSMVALLRD